MTEATALSEKEFDKLTEDLPEDGFRDLVPLIMQSFAKKRGRTLDKTQLACLAVGIMEMGAVIDSQVTMIGELQQQVQDLEKKGKKLWTPQRV